MLRGVYDHGELKNKIISANKSRRKLFAERTCVRMRSFVLDNGLLTEVGGLLGNIHRANTTS